MEIKKREREREREKVKTSCRRNIPESRHGSKVKHYRSKATGYTELMGTGVGVQGLVRAEAGG